MFLQEERTTASAAARRRRAYVCDLVPAAGSASYLGMASALAARALQHKKGSQDDRAMLQIDLQGAALTLRRLASLVNAHRFDAKGPARAQATRFAVREAVNRVGTRAFELGSAPSSEWSKQPAPPTPDNPR